jgi:hypothetical protein
VSSRRQIDQTFAARALLLFVMDALLFVRAFLGESSVHGASLESE